MENNRVRSDPATPPRRDAVAGFDAADRGLLAAGRSAFGDGFRLRSVARVSSTQDLARAAARAGAAAGTCWVAAEQTAGRGRQGRRWQAAPGAALLTSVLLRPVGPLGWVPLAAGLAVVDALRASTGVEAALKWPNDVLGPGGGKLAGLLAEVEPAAAPGPGPAVVLGVGINVRVDAFLEGVDGVSLHGLTAPLEPPRLEALLAALLPALARRLRQVAGDDGGVAALRQGWEAAAAGLGGPVVAQTPTGEQSGTAEGLDHDGALVIRDAGGARHRLVAGDVHLLRPRGS